MHSYNFTLCVCSALGRKMGPPADRPVLVRLEPPTLSPQSSH